MDDWLAQVPAELRGRYGEIVAITDKFCSERLNDEYRGLCRALAASFCQPGTPVHKGKVAGWAAGIVYSIGWVNFVTDPAQDPHVTAAEIAKGCGVSESTMHNRSKDLREGFDLAPFDPSWSLRSVQEHNPFLAMAADLRAAGLVPPVVEVDTEDGQVLEIRLESDRQVAELLMQIVKSSGPQGLEALFTGPLDEDQPEEVLGFQFGPMPELPPGKPRGRR